MERLAFKVVIPARMRSTRLPGKMLADIGGNLRRIERAQLVAEGGFVLCQRQLHGSLLCWI